MKTKTICKINKQNHYFHAHYFNRNTNRVNNLTTYNMRNEKRTVIDKPPTRLFKFHGILH